MKKADRYRRGASHAQSPTLVPPHRSIRDGLLLIGVAALSVLLTLIFVDLVRPSAKLGSAFPSSTASRLGGPTDPNSLTTRHLLAMSDAELDALDPLVMNLVVARGIPELRELDVTKLAAVVDGWARTIDAGNRAMESQDRNTALYRHDRDLWRAGGMAVALAGRTIGITYTSDPLDPGKPEQQFLHGVIDAKRGTCATMPVLYMAIGHRLGWPIKGVVSRDHMWARWDDGRKGGKRFNLEATSASSNGSSGSFNSVDDDYYARELQTPPIAIESGSDMGSLTGRQTLGVFLQARAGYWAAHEKWDAAEHDLLLAASCFPQNRDIREFLVKAMARTNGRYFTEDERSRLASILSGTSGRTASESRRRWAREYLLARMREESFEDTNRRNMEAMQRAMQPPPPPTFPGAYPDPSTPQQSPW